jgi:hypothetical protein
MEIRKAATAVLLAVALALVTANCVLACQTAPVKAAATPPCHSQPQPDHSTDPGCGHALIIDMAPLSAKWAAARSADAKAVLPPDREPAIAFLAERMLEEGRRPASSSSRLSTVRRI